MEQAEIIQDMLETAKAHNLEVEVLISLINNIADDFVRQTASSGEKLFLIAPFGPKPLTLASWIAYKRLTLSGVGAEMAHVSGFQYTSVYSIGKGNMLSFQLPSLTDLQG